MALAKLVRLDHQDFSGNSPVSQAILNGDVVGLAYQSDTSGYVDKVYYRTYDIGGDALGAAVNVPRESGLTAVYPSLAQDSNSRLYVGSMSAISNGFAEIMESSDGGVTWGNRASFATLFPKHNLINIFADGLTVRAVLQQLGVDGGRTVLLTRTGPGTWSNRTIYGVPTDYFRFLSTGGGHACTITKGNSIVIVGYRQTGSSTTSGIYCLYSTDGGANFQVSKIGNVTGGGVASDHHTVQVRLGKDQILRAAWESFNIAGTEWMVRTAYSTDFGITWVPIAESPVWYGKYNTTLDIDIKRPGAVAFALDVDDKWFFTAVDDLLNASSQLNTMHTFKVTGNTTGDITYLDNADIDGTDGYSITINPCRASFFYGTDLYRVVNMYKTSGDYNSELWLLKNAAVGTAISEPGGGGGRIPKLFPDDPSAPI